MNGGWYFASSTDGRDFIWVILVPSLMKADLWWGRPGCWVSHQKSITDEVLSRVLGVGWYCSDMIESIDQSLFFDHPSDLLNKQYISTLGKRSLGKMWQKYNSSLLVCQHLISFRSVISDNQHTHFDVASCLHPHFDVDVGLNDWIIGLHRLSGNSNEGLDYTSICWGNKRYEVVLGEM
jgi:hypothetical protein